MKRPDRFMTHHKEPGICNGCQNNLGPYDDNRNLVDCSVYTPTEKRGIRLNHSYDCLKRVPDDVKRVKQKRNY